MDASLRLRGSLLRRVRAMEKYGIGQPVRRKEDQRFLTGKGRYVDDIQMDGMAHAVVLRSPYAHARITGVDTAAAQDVPGVLLILTGADWEAENLGGIPTRTPVKNKDGSPPAKPVRPGLCKDRVRFVGDAVAFVVAETVAAAKDAAELIEVDYDPLPAVTDAKAALAPDAQRVWDEVPGNVWGDFELGNAEAVEAGLAKEDHGKGQGEGHKRGTGGPNEKRGE